jgi:hypothetical protein
MVGATLPPDARADGGVDAWCDADPSTPAPMAASMRGAMPLGRSIRLYDAWPTRRICDANASALHRCIVASLHRWVVASLGRCIVASLTPLTVAADWRAAMFGRSADAL